MMHVFETENVHESSVVESEEISRAGDTLTLNAKEYFQQVERGEIPFIPQSLSAHISSMRNDNGETLLITAARCGHDGVVVRLLPEIDVDETDHDGWTALLNAAHQGHIKVVRTLLGAGAVVDLADLLAWTPLMWACYKNCVEVVEELIKAHAHVNAAGEDDGLTPLILASGRGYTEIVRKLLPAGAQVNVADKFGSTALIWAARRGYSHIVTELLAAGAELDVIGMQASTALMLASRGNHLKVVNLLLAREPNVNIVDYHGLSALATAAREGYTEVARTLIDAGAFVNLVDRFGNSILGSAVRSGNIHIVRMLLDKHADVNSKDSEGRTPLHLAIDKSFSDIVVAILEKKPNLELKNRDGDTALIRTVKNRDVGLCQLMVNMGAKISATDNAGDNSLHLALRARSKRLTQILLVNPSDSKLLYRPNKLGETPYSIDQEALRPVLPTIFGPIGTDVDLKSLLGFDIYSDVLADVVCEPNLSLPLTVGLYAKWGSGKSLLLPKIRESMRSFSRSWIEGVELYWSWSTLVSLFLLCSLVTLASVALILGIGGSSELNMLYPIGVGLVVYTALASAYGFVYYGSEVRLWNGSIVTARLLARTISRLKILASVLTLNAPMRSNKDLIVSPVSFLFADDHRLSFIGGEQALANIVLSLFTAAEMHFGLWVVRLLCVFQYIHPSRNSKLQTLCGVPVLLYTSTMILSLVLSLVFFIGYSLDDYSQNTSYVAASIVFMGVFLLAGLPLVHFLCVRLLLNSPRRRINRTSHKIHLIPFERLVQKLQREVDLLASVIETLDAFTNSQTRLVITVDGLDSVEQSKMVQILDALTLFFSSRQNAPFIVIYAVDPQIIVSSIQHNLRGAMVGGNGVAEGDGGNVITGNAYLRNIISMPFFLDHVALKDLQGVHSKKIHANHGGGITTFNASVRERKKSETFKGSRLSLREHKDRAGVGEMVPGSIAMAAQNDLNLFPSHDYFSNMNPRSMRRIVNSIALSGRLLRTFDVEFSWISLYNWISLVEQWPYRMCWLLERAMEMEDTGMVLPDLYQQVKSTILVDSTMLDLDRNVGEFDEIISKMKANKQDQLLTVGQMKAFATCTSNLNPQLRKTVAQLREALREKEPLLSDDEEKRVEESEGAKKQEIIPTGIAKFLFDDPQATWARINKPLVRMSIDEIAELVKRLQIPKGRMDELVSRLYENNINGLVLQSCELTELRQILRAPLGDWTLIQLLAETLRVWSPNNDQSQEHPQITLPTTPPNENAQKPTSSLRSINEEFEPTQPTSSPLVEDECVPYTNDERLALLGKRDEKMDDEEEDDDGASTKSVAGSTHSLLQSSPSPQTD